MGGILTRRRLIAAQPHIETASGAVASWGNGVALPIKSCIVTIAPVQSGSGNPSPDNVRPITGWTEANVWDESAYDPTANPKIKVEFPVAAGTVYGGTLDVTNGVLTVDKTGLLLTDDGSWVLSSAWEKTDTAVFYNNFIAPNMIKVNDNYRSVVACSHFASQSRNELYSSDSPGIGPSGSIPSLTIRCPKTIAVTVSEFTDWLAENNVFLVYELATPLTYQLTPQEITTLVGRNVMWADTGDTAVQYWAHP